MNKILKIVFVTCFLIINVITAKAEENNEVRLLFTGSSYEMKNSWQLNIIGVSGYWGSATQNTDKGPINGKGVNVGVIDTGINNHFEYSSRLLAGYDFVKKIDISPSTDSDFNGHGSHVAGIIGAGVNNCTLSKSNNCKNDVAGVAPGVSLIPIRVLGASGSGNWTDVADGIRYSTTQKADVVNLSLGGVDGGALRTSLTDGVKNGQIFAIAAGNDGKIIDPKSIANYAGTLNDSRNTGAIITVGSVTCATSCSIANYSNIPGTNDSLSRWFLVAPGTNILSTYDGTSTATKTLSGTSMATPLVSGAAALLKQYWNKNGYDIAIILLTTADKSGVYADTSKYGQGLLNLSGAMSPYTLANGGALIVTSTSSGTGTKTLNTQTITQTANAAPSAYKTALSSANLKVAGLDDFGRDFTYDLSSLYNTNNSKNYYLEQMFSNMDKNVSTKQIVNEGSKLTFTQIEPKQNYFDDETLGIKNSTNKSNTQLASMSLNTQLTDSQAMTYGINSNTNNFFGFANTPFENSGFIVNKTFDNPYLGFNGSQNFVGFSSKIDNEWNIATGVVNSFNPLTKYQANNDPYQTTTTSLPKQNITSGFVELSKQTEDNKFALSFGSTLEKAGLLGGTTDPLFGITDKSNTMFVSLKNAKNIFGDTWIAGSYNQGLTLKNGQQDSLVSSSSNLISQSWSLGLMQSNVLSKEDRFGIAINQPLVVKSGSLNLNVPTGLEYDTGIMQYENRKVSIAPTAIERNIEANYFVPTSSISGLSLTGIYRMNPENNDSNPSQKAFAVRWQSLF